MNNIAALHDMLNDELFEHVCEVIETELDKLEGTKYNILNAIYSSIVCLDTVTKSEVLTVRSLLSREDVTVLFDRLLSRM